MTELLGIIDLVVDRLRGFNYDPTLADKTILKYLTSQVVNNIKMDINLAELPKELESGVVNRITALFLKEKKAIEPESLEGIGSTGLVKSITEGDTSVAFFETKSSEQRLDEVFRELKKGGLNLSCYRRIRW